MNTSTASAVSLADAARRYKHAVGVVFEAYAERQSDYADQITPGQIDAGIQEFLMIGIRLERGERPPACIDTDQISEFGDYGITLLGDLGGWAQRLGLNELEAEFDAVALAFADWIVRHGGEIRTIEPVVDALANQANRERDTQNLEHLTHLTTRFIRSTAPSARTLPRQPYPNPPWRTMNLNCGIVATRTHNATLMEHVFDELVRNLPIDAPRFFAEGMQQMEKFDFPMQVRAVMTRYFDRWTRPRMN